MPNTKKSAIKSSSDELVIVALSSSDLADAVTAEPLEPNNTVVLYDGLVTSTDTAKKLLNSGQSKNNPMRREQSSFR